MVAGLVEGGVVLLLFLYARIYICFFFFQFINRVHRKARRVRISVIDDLHEEPNPIMNSLPSLILVRTRRVSALSNTPASPADSETRDTCSQCWWVTWKQLRCLLLLRQPGTPYKNGRIHYYHSLVCSRIP